jgi:regulator of ribonuclease activity A
MNPAAQLKTSDLVDKYDQVSSCEVQFRILGRRRAFSGRIRTVKCHEDNALLKSVISTPGAGDVLVVDGGGSLRSALMGDNLAGIASRNGWRGAVIYGAVRDLVLLDAIDFGVKALGSNPRKSTKTGAGQEGIRVSFGGVTFTPGHWLYSDDDGLLVSDVPLSL